MNFLVFDESTASALKNNNSGTRVLMNESADPLSLALQRDTSVLLLPSLEGKSALMIEIKRRTTKPDDQPKAPPIQEQEEERRKHPRESTGFLGLDCDAVYLDEDEEKPSWWHRLFGN